MPPYADLRRKRSTTTESHPLNRRRFLAGAAAAAAAACTSNPSSPNANAASGSGSTATSSATNQPTVTPPPFVSSGLRTRPVVALTFHVSGDPALAGALLDLLRDHRTPITAFMVGTFVDDHPDITRRIVDDGHEVANHTYSHLTF